MKKSYENLNTTQKEALINEYKGNLFEYIVAHQLSRHLGIEKQFLDDFGGAAKERFESYERWLRQNDRALLRALTKLAQPVADRLSQDFFEKSVYTILVVGKSTNSTHNKELKEADLLVLSSPEKDAQFWGVSLKLCKANAFVNTKSGGLKSFFTNYFAHSKMSTQVQEELNREVERSFQQLGHDLYESEGLGEFKGLFDERWEEAGMSHLPGELPEDYRKKVHESYQNLIRIIHSGFKKMQNEDAASLARGIESLMGLGEPRLHQIICFYKNLSEDQRYIFDHLQEQKEIAQWLKQYPPIIPELKSNLASFEVLMGDICLQIRVKPMNRFTQASYKVNCSIKKLKSHTPS